MTADVALRTVAPRPTAVVSQTTTWQQFPDVWRPLLDEVYGFIHGLVRVGPSWEIYGHWRENPSELETEIYYLVQRSAAAAVSSLRLRVTNS
jgi:hypothetical protein